MQTLIYIVTFVVTAYLLLMSVQSRPSFLLLLPILLLTIGVGWYLNKHIQQEHEENLQKGFRYTEDEEDSQHWLHQSFVPKTKILLLKHIKQTIFYCGIFLLLFIFVWSYLVAGLNNALLNVFIALLLYSVFVFYLLHAEKWYKYIFKRVPKTYRHLKTNDWIHGYVILLPFIFVAFLFYVLFNYKFELVTYLLAIPFFLIVYTLVFICLYCFSYVYKEYKKEEQKKVDEAVKKMVEEKD